MSNWRRRLQTPLSKRTRLVAALALGVFAVAVGLRLAILFAPGAGPAFADALRVVLGTDAVTRLEETTADLEDRYKRAVRRGEPPRALDQLLPVPSPKPSTAAPAAAASSAAGPREVDVHVKPADIGPMHASVAAPEDGRWSSVLDPARPRAAPLLFATLLHPDPKRPWAEVFVVAVMASDVRVHAVAGTVEPQATVPEGKDYVRHGTIPSRHHESLLAAFNGGFKTEHGRHGMFVNGVTLVPARDGLCTIVGYEDGTLDIATWRAIRGQVSTAQHDGRVLFWRQAAPCMYERASLNPLLHDEEVRKWGATIEGNVVIRRSAIGLSADRRLLFVSVSNDTTARAMALAMHHAGASDVAQLDVNWSYPRFLLFPRNSDGQRRAQTLFRGFLFREADYVERPSQRDFFYLTRRDG